MHIHKHLREIAVLVLAITTTLAVLDISLVFGDPDKGELLLRFKPGASERSKGELLTSLGLEIVDQIPQIQTLVIRVPENTISQVTSALSHNPMIDFVEENRQVPPSAIPNDPYYSAQWHLTRIEAPNAWDISLGDNRVTIAILDSGVDPNHPDLAARLLTGYNFYDSNYNTSDIYGHGTKVAGVAAAITNNTVGVSAIAWQSSILPVRVTDTQGYTFYSLLAKGLIYAADNGAKSATISFLIYGGHALSSAAKYFMDRGGLVVGAGGNTGSYYNDSDNPYIISVSATTSTDSVATFSTYGPYIDLAAPGASIYTTLRGGGYSTVSGTSFSAPLTAGLTTLMFSANPSLTPTQVEQILKSTAVDLGDLGYDIHYGWGRIDASKALRAVVGITPIEDSDPPKVAITSPLDGATVSGGITVEVDASDNVGISRVELYKDGCLFATDVDSPYGFYWDTNNDPDGVHDLQAKAYDISNNVGESNGVSVSVANKGRDSNPPIVNIIYPQNESKVSGKVKIMVSASDDLGINKIEFYINNKLVATDSEYPYEYQWNSKTVKDGEYWITASASDTSGNSAETKIRIYVSNRK
jgi:thermitase